MNSSNLSFLFLGKNNDTHAIKALDHLNNISCSVTSCLGEWGDKLPDEAKSWQGDYIISYLSRWILPAQLLDKASKAAINFHPASPEYPGIGCNNFALYDEVDSFGSTCHHMNPEVDSGGIIAVKRFSVYPSDSVKSLLTRTYDHQLALFYEIADSILAEEPLPVSPEQWTKEPSSRKQLDQLSCITPQMDAQEIHRRVRATTFQQFKPEIKLGNYTFLLKTSED